MSRSAICLFLLVSLGCDSRRDGEKSKFKETIENFKKEVTEFTETIEEAKKLSDELREIKETSKKNIEEFKKEAKNTADSATNKVDEFGKEIPQHVENVERSVFKQEHKFSNWLRSVFKDAEGELREVFQNSRPSSKGDRNK